MRFHDTGGKQLDRPHRHRHPGQIPREDLCPRFPRTATERLQTATLPGMSKPKSAFASLEAGSIFRDRIQHNRHFSAPAIYRSIDNCNSVCGSMKAPDCATGSKGF
jgi:hypothetical protein